MGGKHTSHKSNISAERPDWRLYTECIIYICTYITLLCELPYSQMGQCKTGQYITLQSTCSFQSSSEVTLRTTAQLSHTHHTLMGFGASQIRYWWHRTHSVTLSLSLTHTCRKKTGGRGVIYTPKARHSTSTNCTQTIPTYTLVRKWPHHHLPFVPCHRESDNLWYDFLGICQRFLSQNVQHVNITIVWIMM